MAVSLSKRIGFSAAMLAGMVLILEVTGHMLPTPAPPLTLPAHPERGWTLPVSAEFNFGGITATTNHLGLRISRGASSSRSTASMAVLYGRSVIWTHHNPAVSSNPKHVFCTA